jgi:5-methylcytosine-specific restriction endonuclease McrBC regulatory subunit McrC
MGSVDIEIHEKIPDTLATLISSATGSSVRVESMDSPSTDFGPVSQYLMKEFIRAAGSYISGRRKPSYRYQAAEGPSLAGSLDMVATMHSHARGRLGLFAYQRCTVVRDEPLDRVVLAGLDGLNRAASALSLDPATAYEGRWLAGALEEVRDSRYIDTSEAEILSIGDEIASDPATIPRDRDLARLAAIALIHKGFEPTLQPDGYAPRGLFLNLEAIFEQAVRETLRELLDGFTVDIGEHYERRVFTEGIDSSKANPDVVIHRDGVVAAVGDVKYKDLGGGKEKRQDLYQVLVHAATLGAERAFLVYPSNDVFGCNFLGRAATGSRTWAIRVRPTELDVGLSQFTTEIGLA